MRWSPRALGAAVLASVASLALVQPATAAQVRLLNADATAGSVTLRVGGKLVIRPAVRAGSTSAWASTKGGVVNLRALQGRRVLVARKVRVRASERVTVALTRTGKRRRLVLVRESTTLSPTTSSLRIVSLVPTDVLTLAADGLPLVRNLPAGRASQIVSYPALGTTRLTLRRGAATVASLDADLPGGVLTVLAAIPNGRGIRLAALPRAAAAPRATVAPSVSSTRPLGSVETGDTLTCQRGTWAPASGLAFAYEWLRDGDLISGRTAATYVLDGTVDAGRDISCRVTAGSATAGHVRRSATNAATLPALPVVSDDDPPTVQGVPDAGQTVTCDPGDWAGARSFTYVWLRNGAAIGGATAVTYPVDMADDGQQLACRVTAENRAGTAAATSAAVQPGDTPGNVSLPAVTGPFADGTAITTMDGSWSPADGLAFTYAWLRCDAAGLDCVVIDGATAATYTPGASDVGATLRLRVIATRAGFASSPADSLQSAPVAPRSTVAPTIMGTQADGGTLTAVTGTWNGVADLDFTYAWESSANGADWDPDVTTATRLLAPADVGLVFRVTVGASRNGSAVTTATSFATARINLLATGTPAISGTLRDGSTLTTASPASHWNNATGTIVREFTWQSFDGSVWVTVHTASTTGLTDGYTLTATEVGKPIRVSVNASKSGSSGTFSGWSTATAAISPIWVGGAPAAPSGTAIDDQTLTAPALDEARWSGSATTTLTYEWRQCDQAGSNCTPIVGATGATYRLVADDVGHTIRVVLFGSGGPGSDPGASLPSDETAVVAPLNTALPSISGVLRVGSPVGTSTGSWNGAAPLTFAYRWFSCTTTSAATCSVITGETDVTYTPQAGDVGLYLRSEVTASKGGASSAPAVSAASSDPIGQLENTVAPAVSGTTTVGQSLTTTDGTWLATPSATFTYQWQQSPTGADSWTNVVGQTSDTLSLSAGLYNQDIRVQVTATNDVGAVTENSNEVGPIAGLAPANTAVPTIGGTEEVGSTLSMTSAGAWTGTPAPTLSRTWQRSDDGVGGWADIGGATATTYVLAPADDGKFIRLHVHGTNAEGSDDAFSDPTGAVAGAAAANTAAPVLSGVEQVGEQLSVTDGTWTGTPAPTLSYRWERSPDGTTWSPIGGATAATYTLVALDSGNQVRAVVVGSNPFGDVDAPSNATGVIP